MPSRPCIEELVLADRSTFGAGGTTFAVMTTFFASAACRQFMKKEADGTAEAVRFAITLVARDMDEAEAILELGRLPGCGERESHDKLYELIYRNEATRPSALHWHGNADWAVRAAGRLRENRAAGCVPAGHRQELLATENLTLFASGDYMFAEQANPVAGRSGRIWTYVSAEQVALAQRGAAAANALAREIALVRVEGDDDIGVAACRVRAIRDWLIDNDPDPAGLVVVALSRGSPVAGVRMQRFDADGQQGALIDYAICVDDIGSKVTLMRTDMTGVSGDAVDGR